MRSCTRAIVHSNKVPRVESFCRLVNLGGGKVVKAEPPFSDPKGATHCLYEKVPNVSVDFKVRNEHTVNPDCNFICKILDIKSIFDGTDFCF